MIVPARRRAPRSQNYRTGVWSGLGATAPVYEDCGIDPACIVRNNVKEQAYNMAVLSETRQKQLAFCLSDPGYSPTQCHAQFDPGGIQDQTANAGEAVRTTAAPVSNIPLKSNTTQTSGGRVTFTTLRGTNALQVGDTWKVSITGATPNAPVTVNAGGAQTSMGKTDANGNFSLEGTARTVDVGNWNELWAVGNLASGAFQFTIAPATTPAGKQVVNSSGASNSTGTGGDAGSGAGSGTGADTGSGSGSGTGASSSSTVIGGFDLSSIPTWGWLAAAGVAAFFMFGKGGR